MEISDIKKNTNKGLKWVFLLTSLSIPLQMFISIILGRSSSELLGKFGLVELYLSIVVTFFLYGGETVLIKFIPELKSSKEKVNFIFSYCALVMLIYLIVSLGFYFFNVPIELLLGESVPSEFLVVLLAMGFFHLIFFIITSSLKGMMLLKEATLLQKSIIVLQVVYFAFMIYLIKEFNEWAMILNGTFLIVLLITIISVIFFYKIVGNNKGIVGNSGILLPNGFWKYSFFIHLTTISIFLYEKIDQIVILKNFDISILGIYFACYKIAQFIRFIPKVINQALLPAFSAFLSSNSDEEVREYYKTSIRYNNFFSAGISILLILFSNEILLLYGEEYSNYSWLMIGLSIIFMLGIPSQINSNLINLYGKSNYFFKISITTIVVQFIILFFSVNKIGLLSLIVAKMASVLVGLVLSNIVLKRINDSLSLPKNYYYSILLVILASTFSSFEFGIKSLVAIVTLTALAINNKDIVIRTLKKFLRK